MPIYPITFLGLFLTGTLLSVFVGPIYGLAIYYFTYFNIPELQWWGSYVPQLRWSLLSIVILLISCIIHNKRINTLGNLKQSPFKFLVLIIILNLFALPFSYSYDLSVVKVQYLSKYALIYFFTLIVIANVSNLKIILYLFSLLFLNIAILGHFYFNGSRLDGVGLVDANDANLLAALVLLIIPILIQFIIHGNKYEKILSAIIILPILNLFMMCGSRGGFIGLIVSIATLLALQVTRKNILLVIIAFSTFATILYSLMGDNYRDRIFNLKNSIKQGQVEESSAGRVTIWINSLKMLQDYPLGTGGGGFMKLSPQYLQAELLDGQLGQRACHNTYLLLLIEQGPIGLLLYIAFIWSTFRALFKGKKVIGEMNSPVSQDAAGKRSFLLAQTIAFISALGGFWTASFFIDRVYFEGIYIFSALAITTSFIIDRQHHLAAPNHIST